MRFRVPVLIVSLLIASLAHAQDGNPPGLVPTPDDSDDVVREPSYSSYASRKFPTNVYFCDTHVHTDNVRDAKGFGANLDVETAFRFARGEKVTSNTGMPFKLSRPLDWIVVADHSDGMGAMKEIFKGNPNLIKDPTVRDWANEQRIKAIDKLYEELRQQYTIAIEPMSGEATTS